MGRTFVYWSRVTHENYVWKFANFPQTPGKQGHILTTALGYVGGIASARFFPKIY